MTPLGIVLSGILLLHCLAFLPNASTCLYPARRTASNNSFLKHLLAARKGELSPSPQRPRLVVFDLDGCLWRPELYQLARGQRNGQEHSPFAVIGDGTMCKSRMGSVLRLIGDVPEVLDELATYEGDGVQLAISSRTDESAWARELLSILRLPKSGKTLDQLITGPWEIANENKVKHFERLKEKTGIPFSEMMFFDNERGNCKSVSRLGVTVGFSPNGVTREVFDNTMAKYPAKWGVVGLEI